MCYRIYADESGTHGGDWLVIGMLFVPNHGPLHAALCKVKDDLAYFNASPKIRAKYKGSTPYIAEFQHTNSQRDANQCLQLCDLLTGCLYQSLAPSTRREKKEMRAYLEDSLRPLGIADLTPAFWRQFAQTTLTQRFPKFSAWFWRPTKGKKRKGEEAEAPIARKKRPGWADGQRRSGRNPNPRSALQALKGFYRVGAQIPTVFPPFRRILP